MHIVTDISMEEQPTDYFLVNRQKAKLTLTPSALLIYTHTASLHFPFALTAHLIVCPHSLLLKSPQTSLQLTHTNSSVLSKWEQLLSHRLHRVDFKKRYSGWKKVAEGGSAEVYRAVERRSKMPVAVKVFRRDTVEKNQNQGLAFMEEVKIMREVNDSYFPCFVGTFMTENSFYLVMEWCEGITAEEWVRRGLACQEEVKQIVRQLATALCSLHRRGIVHRDIKPQNIVYNPLTSTVKIIDFGFAAFLHHSPPLFPNCGTAGFAAPELLDRHKYILSAKADVFSLGVTVYFMLFGRLPYAKKVRSLAVANKMCQFEFDREMDRCSWLGDFVKRTLCGVGSRMGMEETLKHSYLQSKREVEQCEQMGQGQQIRETYCNATSPFTVNQHMLGNPTLCSLSPLDEPVNHRAVSVAHRKRIHSTNSPSLLHRALSRSKGKSKYHRLVTERI